MADQAERMSIDEARTFTEKLEGFAGRLSEKERRFFGAIMQTGTAAISPEADVEDVEGYFTSAGICGPTMSGCPTSGIVCDAAPRYYTAACVMKIGGG